MATSQDLAARQCKPCTAGTPPLSQDMANQLVQQLDGWMQYDHLIGKTFQFKNYYQTIAFVNAVAFVAHVSDHHPDLSVFYNRCTVRFNTHDVGGISGTDFECASAVDALLQ